MSLDENKAIVRSLFEALNKHNPDLLDEFYASDYVNHTLQLEGLESLKQFESMIYNASADWKETIEDIIAEGDKVWIYVNYSGTHTGEFMGVAPTGKKVTAKGVDIYRIVNGKLAEYWNVTDNMHFNTQIGLIEYTEQGKQLFQQK